MVLHAYFEWIHAQAIVSTLRAKLKLAFKERNKVHPSREPQSAHATSCVALGVYKIGDTLRTFEHERCMLVPHDLHPNNRVTTKIEFHVDTVRSDWCNSAYRGTLRR